MKPRYAILQAPSVLGLRPTGVQALPEALLDAGLAVRLGARHAGSIEPPDYDDTRDRTTGLLNMSGIAQYTPRLAEAITQVLDNREFPLVLGGDCSIVLGCMLALRRRGRHGLLFLDGHADFYQPEANVNGEVASSDLAFMTGRGPEQLTLFEGYRPLVRDEDVVAFGYRDGEEAAAYGSQPLPHSIMAVPLAEMRAVGAQAAALNAVAHLSRDASDGFWIHLDADVLDDAIMPAVDYRLPGGASWAELHSVLRAALATGHAIGMDVTIFNPRLDQDGAIARSFTDTLVHALSE